MTIVEGADIQADQNETADVVVIGSGCGGAVVAKELAAAGWKVIILESGGAERSAAEYLGGHAKNDAEFLKTAKHQPGHRIARASGDLAWVASDNDMVIQQDGKPVTIASAETMVLRRTGGGWKIVHIHWSSRARKT